MLKIKTSIENGTAIIYILSGETLINGLTRSFSSDEEAQQWLASRGVNSIENFTTFIDYVLTKGALGEKVVTMLKEEPIFSLNGILGSYEVDVRNCYIRHYCQRLA